MDFFKLKKTKNISKYLERLKMLQGVNPLQSIAKRGMCQGPRGAHPCPQDAQARQVSNSLYLCPRLRKLSHLCK